MADFDFQNLVRKKASYKGFEFDFSNLTEKGGRRIVEHIYPNVDDHYIEDLGKKPNNFSVAGYITLPEIDIGIDILKATLDEGGVGRLFLPMLNIDVQAHVKSYSIKPRKDSLGKIEFEVEFASEGQTVAPVETQNNVVRTDQAASTLQGQAGADFESSYDDSGTTTAAIKDAAVDDLTDFAGFTQQVQSFYFVPDAALNFLATITDVVEDAIAIVNAVDQVATTIRIVEAFVESIKDIPERLREALSSLTELDFFKDDDDGSEISKRIANNADALQVLVNRYAVAELCRVTVAIDYKTQDAATAARVECVEKILEAQRVASVRNEPEAYDALAALLRFVGAEFQLKADFLSSVDRVETITPRTSLSLAHDLFGDPTKAADLILQNDVSNGSFMRTEVEYLANG